MPDRDEPPDPDTTDSTAPTWPSPSLIAASIGSTSVRLAWSAAVDDVAVTGYDIYRDGTLVVSAAGTATSIDVTDLDANATYVFQVQATDAAGNLSTDGPTTTYRPVPPDPATVAPPTDPGSVTPFADATSFLYTGPDPIQSGVVPGTIDPRRAAVLRGRVTDAAGTAIAGANVTVHGHPELGITRTRADGVYDLAVNGGGTLTVRIQRAGYLPVDRQIATPWQDFTWLPDVVLTPLDTASTVVNLASMNTITVARGTSMSDADGARQATLMFEPGTTATLVHADGTTTPLPMITVRATEYTVGHAGPRAMPAELPPATAYTYAVELSIDEALTEPNATVTFNQPVPLYLENFLEFPTGSAVPTGYYDRARGAWVPSDNGRVIGVVAIAGGVAELDVDGDGLADNEATLTALGIDVAERQRLATLYTQGQTLWRVPIPHFTPWDCNWPFGPPDDATSPGEEAPPPEEEEPEEEDSCEEEGSIILAHDRALIQKAPVAGARAETLVYSSARVPGRKSTLRIPLTGSSLPASLNRVKLEVLVAGQRYEQSFAPGANLSERHVWNGRDAYGRPVQGQRPMTVRIGYDYPAIYYPVRSDFARSFSRVLGNATGTVGFEGRRGAQWLTVWQTYERSAGTFTFTDLGGWNVASRHAYDPSAGVLYLGDGRRRNTRAIGQVMGRAAGTGAAGFSGDGGPATQAQLSFPTWVDVASDGSVYVADYGNHAIRKIAANGTISTVAGTGTAGFSGEGGPATAAQLNVPWGFALGPDDSIYIADSGNARIRRVRRDGIIETVAGTGVSGFSGDGGPATAAQINIGFGIAPAVGPDGSIYIPDPGNQRIRKVAPDGIITTIAGTGVVGFSGDGGNALLATFRNPDAAAIGPDGSLYIADYNNARIRRIAPDGIITTVAGSGSTIFSGDGGPATQAGLAPTYALDVMADGSLVIGDYNFNRIRIVNPQGIITTVAGTGVNGVTGDDGPAAAAQISGPWGVAAGPDGTIYIADSANNRVRRVAPALPTAAATDLAIPSDTENELYVFDQSGRHLRTLDILTNAVRRELGYVDGRLTSITDAWGNVTQITRNAAGAPTSIVSPGGHTTAFAVDSNGYVASITTPAGETRSYTYDAGGLMAGHVDGNGHAHAFMWDTSGALVRDDDPAGGRKLLTRTPTANGYRLTAQTALGRSSVYEVGRPAAGGRTRRNTRTWGASTDVTRRPDGVSTSTAPDGTFVSLSRGGDPRFGMLAPVGRSFSMRLPSGLTSNVSASTSAILATPGDPLSATSVTSTLVENGRNYVQNWDRPTRTMTVTTPAGREMRTVLDAKGQVVERRFGNLQPMRYTYDAAGRMLRASWGTGSEERPISYAYATNGTLSSVTDPLGRVYELQHDAADRLVGVVLPTGAEIRTTWDANNRMASFTPPDRPAYVFASTPVERPASDTSPSVGGGTSVWSASYDADRQLASVARPDGVTIQLSQDTGGRITGVSMPGATMQLAWEPAGRLGAVSASWGQNVSFVHDGALTVSRAWTGTISGEVATAYNADHRIVSETVNGGSSITFAYDSDGMLLRAGALTATRVPQTGLVSGTTIGSVTETRTWDGFAELAGTSVAFGATPLYAAGHRYDGLARITETTETIAGSTVVWTYEYDLDGRLVAIRRGGVLDTSYTYDANGNRTTRFRAGVTESRTYDDRDQLLTAGATTYTWSAAGELIQKQTGTQSTTYAYSPLGPLASVTLPSGTQIEYVLDGQGRRVGKRRDGMLVQGFVYRDLVYPAAQLDGTGAVVSRFVYGTRRNVPDYLVRGGVTYRIVADVRGSPRLVVDVATGTIAQRLDYDELGHVTLDTNPGFQPFGFAGGLYDPDTGLVHFGAREYDPEAGRFTTRDPIGFSGGPNLYMYGLDDPINLTDPLGFSSGQTKQPDGFTIPFITPVVHGDAEHPAQVAAVRAHEMQHIHDQRNLDFLKQPKWELERRGFAAEIPILEQALQCDSLTPIQRTAIEEQLGLARTNSTERGAKDYVSGMPGVLDFWKNLLF